MPHKYIIITVSLFCLISFSLRGEELSPQDGRISGEETVVPNDAYEPLPVLSIFHEVGRNLLHVPAHNYGLDFAASGLLSFGMIEGGFDWWYYKRIYGNAGLRGWGTAANYIGFIAPVASPVIAYAIGQFTKDRKLQVLGAALAQSAFTATGYQILIKVFTGRQQMCNGVSDAGSNDYSPASGDYSKMFRWGFLGGSNDSDPFGFIDGWPSGHMANAMSAAVIVSEIYDDNIWVSIGAYTYAALIGVGMSFFDHWSSDIVGGALIGFAVGKTIGKSFKKLLTPEDKPEKLSFYITPAGLGVIVRL
jgi:membrane-associated phospholipid phosphatase